MNGFCVHGFPTQSDNACIFCEVDQANNRAKQAEAERDKFKAMHESAVKGAFDGMQIQAKDMADLRQRAESAEKERDYLKAKLEEIMGWFRGNSMAHMVEWFNRH